MRCRAGFDSHEGIMTQHRILFVCQDNICRSALAEAAMRLLMVEEDRLDDFLLDSAGLALVPADQQPNPGVLWAARACRLDLGGRRARRVDAADFRQFDLLLTMDGVSADALRDLAPAKFEHKVHRLLDFSPWIGVRDIACPAPATHERLADMVDLIQLAVRGLMASIDQADAAFQVPEVPRARLKASSCT